MRTIALLVAPLALLMTSAAARPPITIDTTIGTTGLAVNIQTKVHPRAVIRGGYSHLEYDVADENYDGVDYDVSLNMNSFSGFVDFHPFKNGFTMTAGVYGGSEKEATLNAIPIADVQIGDVLFTPEQVGELTATATLGKLSPYVGIGWDSGLYRDGRVGVLIRAGAMFTGDPEIDLLSESGSLSQDPTFLAELEKEARNLEDEVSNFKVYPVVNVGLSVRF